jgi:hypothetical protein
VPDILEAVGLRSNLERPIGFSGKYLGNKEKWVKII